MLGPKPKFEEDLYNERDVKRNLIPDGASLQLKKDNGVDFGVLESSNEDFAEMIEDMEKAPGCYDQEEDKLMVKLFRNYNEPFQVTVFQIYVFLFIWFKLDT